MRTNKGGANHDCVSLALKPKKPVGMPLNLSSNIFSKSRSNFLSISDCGNNMYLNWWIHVWILCFHQELYA